MTHQQNLINVRDSLKNTIEYYRKALADMWDAGTNRTETYRMLEISYEQAQDLYDDIIQLICPHQTDN